MWRTEIWRQEWCMVESIEPLDPGLCPHASIIRRDEDKGIPLTGLYCLDCGSLVKRVAHKEYARVGPVMDMVVLKDLRARLGWDKPKPDNIRLAEDAPGYAAIRKGLEE
jgi:hypothetical protein